MDQRKHKRVALAAGLLFLVLAVCMVTAVYGAKEFKRSEQRKLGALILQHPELEQEYIALLREQEEPTAPAEGQAEKAGRKLEDKYGISGPFGAATRSLYPYLAVMLLTVAAGAFFLFIIWRRIVAEERDIRERELETEEKYRDLKMRFEQTRHQLEQEENDTKALITDISHQLKTPIASLRMSHEIMDTTNLTPEERQEFDRKGYEEVKKLEVLLESLLNLSKLETKLIEIRPVPTELKETLTKAVSSVYMKAYDKHIDISMEEFPEIVIPHDPRWTVEAFANILDNGVKYSPEFTKIQLRVSEMVSCMLIEIEDQGIGISPGEAHRIFKRFYRGESESVKEQEGSGVGLYLARKIFEGQGGSICVKGARTGGSIFQVTLPKE